jgi:hypothetical protein
MKCGSAIAMWQNLGGLVETLKTNWTSYNKKAVNGVDRKFNDQQ